MSISKCVLFCLFHSSLPNRSFPKEQFLVVYIVVGTLSIVDTIFAKWQSDRQEEGNNSVPPNLQGARVEIVGMMIWTGTFRVGKRVERKMSF